MELSVVRNFWVVCMMQNGQPQYVMRVAALHITVQMMDLTWSHPHSRKEEHLNVPARLVWQRFQSLQFF